MRSRPRLQKRLCQLALARQIANPALRERLGNGDVAHPYQIVFIQPPLEKDQSLHMGNVGVIVVLGNNKLKARVNGVPDVGHDVAG